MSRFNQKYYKRLLESAKPENYRNAQPLNKEKLIWKPEGLRKFINYDKIFAIAVFGMFLGLLLMLLSILYNRNSFLFVIGIIIGFGPFLAVITCLFGRVIWIKTRCRKIIRNREDIELEKFIAASPILQKYNTYHIKAIRQALGHIYSVSPKKIYLCDTGKSLASFGCTVQPYGFEVIFGVGKKLGIFLTDYDIDRIAERIHNNAKNVEELTAILCEEMSAAEEIQSIKGVDIHDTKEDIKTHEYIFGLIMGCLAALAWGLSKVNTIVQNEESIFNLSAIISILIAVVISFLAGFIFFTGMIKLDIYFNKERPKKPATPGEIDLEELKELADVTPVKRYVNCWLMELYSKQQYEATLRKYEPLPLIDDIDPEETPLFAEIAERLKKMAKIEQIPFIKPHNGTIALIINGKPVNLNVEFCDGLKKGYIKLSIEK